MTLPKYTYSIPISNVFYSGHVLSFRGTTLIGFRVKSKNIKKKYVILTIQYTRVFPVLRTNKSSCHLYTILDFFSWKSYIIRIYNTRGDLYIYIILVYIIQNTIISELQTYLRSGAHLIPITATTGSISQRIMKETKYLKVSTITQAERSFRCWRR